LSGNAAPAAEEKRGANEGLSMNNVYLEVISLVERLHRQFLEVVKLELEGIGIHDINNVQAMMLFNIGDAEMTVGELTLRGCYLGSNVSYNVKKMVENGYLAHERSVHDRRSIHVRLTERGIKLRDSLTAMHQRHAEMLSQAMLSAEDLQASGTTLRRLERFWIRAADLVQRPQPQFAPALPHHPSGAAPPRPTAISAR
jgi:DNA-binding MarR family transcriptional regulator